MSYNVYSIPPFDRQLKKLVKKFPSLKMEYIRLIEELEENPVKGKSLGKNCYKIRLAMTSKGKGKSGGARVIVNIQYTNDSVFLLTIYDKSEFEDITDNELKYLLSFIR